MNIPVTTLHELKNILTNTIADSNFIFEVSIKLVYRKIHKKRAKRLSLFISKSYFMLKHPDKEEEEKLIGAIRNRSQQAFGVLYDRYAAVLMGITMQLLEDKELAEKALNNTFISVWEGIRSQNLKKAPCGLFVYLLHTVRKEAERLKLEKAETKSIANQPVENFVSLNGVVIDRNADAAPRQQYRDVWQCYFNGYSATETATVLNIPLQEVNYKIRNDLKTIRGSQTI